MLLDKNNLNLSEIVKEDTMCKNEKETLIKLQNMKATCLLNKRRFFFLIKK